MIECFLTNNSKDRFAKAFAKSVNGITHKNEVEKINQYGVGQWPTFNFKVWTERPVAVVGILRGTETILWEATRRKHEFYYFDHAYLYATRDYQEGKYGLLYRCIKNQLQMNYIQKLEAKDYKRISKYRKPEINDFREGQHILVFPPTRAVCRYYGYNEARWIADKISILRKHTDREIIVRTKDTEIPLQDQLRHAHAVVSSQSTAAIEAVLSGVPSFCEEISQCLPVSKTDLSEIEKPYYPDRGLLQRWIDSLLACQFTFEEIENGTCYEAVKRLQHDYNT